jgi:hypothetical protein
VVKCHHQSRTGSLAKGAGGEGVGPGLDIVLERVKGWKMRNNYNNIDGWGGDERFSTTKIKNSH